jgi:hypothetical protein
MIKFIFALCLLIGVAYTETVIEEVEEKSAQDIQQENLNFQKKSVKKLSKEEKLQK